MSADPRRPGSRGGRAPLPRNLSPRQADRRHPARSFPGALGLTVLNAFLPGTGFLAAGRRKLGAVTLLAFALLVGGAAWLATAGQRYAARLAVDTDRLLWVFAGLVAVGVLWVLVIVAGYRMLLPWRMSAGQHAIGAVLVLALVLGVGVPAYFGSMAALAQRDLIAGVFTGGRSATVEDVPDPFGDKERVNVLLLGGDAGEGRQGTRTDTVIVASISTETGDTVLFSLPRNLEELPFPEDSPLSEVYPDGFDAGSESESLLNAVYQNGPAMHPDILGPTDNPGADFLKLGVGEALGLHIDYFVLVNLDGFERLVDALGGITVNVNYYVPIGGDPGTGALPNDYIEPGPNQHMDGFLALQFARGRFGLTDYDRMARQRCTIQAIIEAADPVTLLRRYQELAETTQDIVLTDVPQRALDDFVDLAFLVKDASVRSVVFDSSVITPAYPDYDLIRQIVSDSLAPPSDGGGNGGEDEGGGDGTAAPSEEEPAPSTAPSEEEPAPGAAAVDVADACAYDPEQAEEARAQGEPPNQND
jgi:LCP family protein required for cell wall assembly